MSAMCLITSCFSVSTCLCRVLWWCLLLGCRVVALCWRQLLQEKPSLSPSPSSRAPSERLRSPSAGTGWLGTSEESWNAHLFVSTRDDCLKPKQRDTRVMLRGRLPLQLLVVPLVGLAAGEDHRPGEAAGLDPRHELLTELFGLCLRWKAG